MARELARVPGLRVVPPDGAFYYFVDVRAFGESIELARRAVVEQGVITIPGEAFGERGAGWLRVSFACDERDLVEGVRRLARTLEAHPR
jgi:aminotransferase